MKNLLVIPLALCFVAFLTSQVNAQFGYYGGNYGGVMGGSNYYNDNYTDPRLGYCLKNDCYGDHGYGGYGQGGYGHGGCGCARVYVRVRVGGGSAIPSVQSYYPQIQCPGCYGNSSPNSQSANRYVTNNPQQKRTTGPSRNVRPSSSGSSNASYRYRF